MQVTLNIDSANIGGTVEQVFQTLSTADKKDLARQVMLEVLQKPMGAERAVYEQALAERIFEAKKNSGGYDRIDTIQKARESYEFREQMGKYQSSRERMVAEITSTAIKHYKEMVDQLVKEDEQLAALMAVAREQFVADFPKLIQMSMAAYFASQMNGIGQAIMTATNANIGVGMLGQNLKQQLANQGIHIPG